MQITISIPNIVINISNKPNNLNLENMAHSIDELIAEVQESKTLAAGVQATISGLRQKVADAIANAGSGTSDEELAAIQAKVDEAFAELAASNDQIAGALVENTPTDGSTTPPVTEPTPDPVPVPPVDTTTPPVDVPATPTPTDGTDVPTVPVDTTTPATDVPATDTPAPVVDAPAPDASATTDGGVTII